MNDIRKHLNFQTFKYNHLTVLSGVAALLSMLLPQEPLHSWMIILGFNDARRSVNLSIKTYKEGSKVANTQDESWGHLNMV